MGSLEDPLPTAPSRPRILFIDAYDSFSNNITSLLTTLLDVDVFVLPIDTPISKGDFRCELDHYDAVVCGPGPGSPDTEADVGLMRWLWELDGSDLIPVLGVCLGFQSLVLACGGKARRLRRGLHGMVRTIQHRSENTTTRDRSNIFEEVGHFKATLYHSLCADVGQDAVSDWEREKWNSPPSFQDIIPLAWVEEDRGPTHGPEKILMALKHRNKPFWGVQYHPESVCTESEGNKVIQNWFQEALRWNFGHSRTIKNDTRNIIARNAVLPSLLQQLPRVDQQRGETQDTWKTLLDAQDQTLFQSQTIPLPDGTEVPDIAEILNSTEANHIILDSANGNQPPPGTGVDVRGRFSIIALEVDHSLQIEHHTGDEFITVRNISQLPSFEKVPLGPGQSIWHLLAEFHESRHVSLKGPVPNEDDVPFLGGFLGYVTYEQGLSGINVPLLRDRGHKRPDVCLAWISKSIVIDHEKHLLHVQHLDGDGQWIQTITKKLEDSMVSLCGHQSQNTPNGFARYSSKFETVVHRPQQAKYEAKVRMCQEYIAAGDSYELCLTDQTKITRAVRDRGREGRSGDKAARVATDSSWHLYRTLRRRNPAPFASYIRLGGATLVSSSPERFLQYSRSGLCSMKPMKGTVKKSSEPGDGCATTLAEAEAILHVPKEEAENLMIVDLVRHDLHGICGAGMVTVPDLLKVEEYQTVYTMITQVEGQLPRPGTGGRYSGLDVLSASLPPGSMTGAPKKRSCEILQQIENGKERSLYSGVVGYMCVTGRGDWSVTIRSMFRWDDECGSGGEGGQEEEESWYIGAGGAVTILSTPEGEREEMFVKLARPLSIFTES